MCGRFSLYSSAKAIKEQFMVEGSDEIEPNYNISPGQRILVIRHNDEKRRILTRQHWGLIPSWLKSEKEKGVINARYESVHEKPYFRSSFKKRRCLILADGWYEWRKMGEKKQPYYFKRKDGRLLAFAGLWSPLREDDSEFESCAIITRNTPQPLYEIHDRMPLILNESSYTAWLGDGTFSLISDESANQFSMDAIEFFSVSMRVNNPRNNTPQCIIPMAVS